jgi:hypothetical protein
VYAVNINKGKDIPTSYSIALSPLQLFFLLLKAVHRKEIRLS